MMTPPTNIGSPDKADATSSVNASSVNIAENRVRKKSGELYRRMMRHIIILLFTAGVFFLFTIEGLLPFWAACLGFVIIFASSFVYTGRPQAINPALWRAERRYAIRRDAADLLPHPFLLLGLDCRIRLANKAARALFQRKDLHTKPLATIIRDPVILDACRQSVESGEPCQALWSIRVPVERHFHVHIAPSLQPRRGMKPFIIFIFNEQTEIKRAHQVKSDFVDNVSFSLKTPLTALRQQIQKIGDGGKAKSDFQKDALSALNRQAEKMALLVEDLLLLSDIEQKEHQRPNQEIDLSDIINHAKTRHHDFAKRVNMEIDIISMPKNVKITGDEKQLRQAISNLIHNALTHAYPSAYPSNGAKKSSQPRKIQISVSETQALWVIEVSDFGAGIASTHIPRLTERFYRVHLESDNGDNGDNGTGLGLAIVKHILTRHGGRLKIKSEKGKGSVFSAFLPKNQP